MLDMSSLPAIDPFSAVLVNQIARARWVLAVAPDDPEGSVPSALVFALTSEQKFEAGDVEIRLLGQFGDVGVVVKAGLIDALSDQILPGWRQEQPGQLPLRWRAVLVATHVARLAAMDSVITDIGCSVLTGRRVHRSHGTSLSGAAAFDGRSWPACLKLDIAKEARPVMPLPAVGELPRRGAEPGFACLMSAGSRKLGLADYRGLCAGDLVLVFSESSAGGVPLWGDIDGLGRVSFLATPDGVLTVRSVNSSGYGTMASQGTEFPSDEAPVHESPEDVVDELRDEPDASDPFFPEIDRPVEDLPVTLDFRLGTRRLTLADVRALAPGAILDLEVNLTDPLTILANGSVIGRGHLIQVGDHIGVQITHWPADREDGDG